MKTTTQMMNRSIAVALVAVTLGAAACSKKPETSAADSVKAATVTLVPTDIATAELRSIGAGVSVSGNLDPSDVVELKAQVAGTVTGVRVDRGSRVSRGSTLASIEAQGVRSLAAGAEAQVAAARAQLSIAQQRLEGAKRLHEAGAISTIEYKTAQANVDAAEAQVAAARAQAAGAGESAARATITAPINGVVSARAVNGGEAVSVGASLFTIVNASELELAGQVSVEEAARVRPGQPVTFKLDAYPGKDFSGRVARVDPTADPGTRQVGVYVRLPNPGSRMIGGQFARGIIETGGTSSSVAIPEAALLGRSADSAQVFVIASDRIARRIVTLGARDETSGLISIRTGIKAGERVLLNPSADIGDGTLVSIAADKRAASAP